MPPPDAFDPDVLPEHLLFGFVLGLAVGLSVSGGLLARRGQLRTGVALVAAGFVLGLAAGASAFDRLPVHPVEFQLKVFLSEALESVSLVVAGLAGVVAALFAVLTAGKARNRGLAAAAGGVAVLVFGGLAAVHQLSSTERLRHPAGTDTSNLVGATIVVAGVSSPTGLAIAPNGDLAVIEAFATRLRVYSPAGDGFEQQIEARIPVADGQPAFHVAFHPAYPAEPYVYVSARDERANGPELRIFRGRIAGTTVTFEPIIDGLPMGSGGNHYGSALAFCGPYLFVSTGDTEFGDIIFAPVEDGVTVRQRAQRIDDPGGKILRYRLDGVDLEPDGIVAGEFPVYAMGFRNPFGMACDDPEAETLVVAENGTIGHDQVRLVGPGTNHGWPISNERDEIEPPLLDTGVVIITPTGAAVGPAGSGREAIITAFTSAAVYSLALDGTEPRLRLLAEAAGGAFAVVADARGCVYFSSAEAIWRLDDGRCSQ